MKNFYTAVKDERSSTFEIIGPISDDRPIIREICSMQDANMKVLCEAFPDTSTKEQIIKSYISIDYHQENKLLERLRNEYKGRTV